MTRIDNDAIARQLGLSREEMKARFGNPGETSPEEIGKALGMDHDKIVEVFGERVSGNSGDSFSLSTPPGNDTGGTPTDEQVAADDKIKDVADKLGFDVRLTEKIMSALADGSAVAGMDHQTAVETLANQLGIDKYYVGMVLEYLDETHANDETPQSNNTTGGTPTDEQVAVDDKIKSVADALGFDAELTEKIMSALGDGSSIAGMDHQTAIETLANELGIDKYYVGMVLEYLDETHAGEETPQSNDAAADTPTDEQVARDDKFKTIADKLGFDVEVVKDIMSAIEDGTSIAGMDHQKAVETLSNDLGINKYYVGMVLEYLDEFQGI